MSVLSGPASLRATVTTDPKLAAEVELSRGTIRAILDGADQRLLILVGPCSVHDPRELRRYATGLAEVAAAHAEDVYLVVRAYTEKPRTRHGWPGLLLDPGLDGGYAVPAGLAETRRVLTEINTLGLPVACEFVEPQLAPYLSDLVSWAGIGARTVESPPHRRLASHLPMPVGFKNRVDGAITPAVDAIAVASRPQPVITVDDHGRCAWTVSDGNPDTHLVLRGGETGTNYAAHQVNHALGLLADVQSHPKLIVDCSHGNSGKDHNRQPVVAEAIAAQIAAGQTGIAGVMLESYLSPGAQSLDGTLRPGVSVTDACLGFADTAEVIENLALAAKQRRAGRTTELVNVR
ncbi:3-deoxy-7-phosphoheptulonate synthase [Stackebrandtia nassauensis]|uniref:Phospho-2-dehydro-3-deoxyheptonate aldolase n=1 Tax=Stackebrandtia nassauensis (strain DSM 44728 / CIP 108903 / NRRL B-16338 / NBRC 102104 / LLR-40K-21) TaxID=446470 RepID=D3Q5B4_STANL|nr:3-deoxy-7-phosphoheptulonate synthase [Stackebrandtia nassauensis]ADD44163.1 phospho-2-dehydro-3-deoxyheptonate aldolase [Stackebrandtia nassauensis DSM 44728]